MKIRPVGAELFHADRRTDREADRWTDMKKLIVAFRNFENAPKTGPNRRLGKRSLTKRQHFNQTQSHIDKHYINNRCFIPYIKQNNKLNYNGINYFFCKTSIFIQTAFVHTQKYSGT